MPIFAPVDSPDEDVEVAVLVGEEVLEAVELVLDGMVEVELVDEEEEEALLVVVKVES